MSFVTIRDIRELTKNVLGMDACEDLGILIDLAAAYQQGKSLSVKQLLLLQGGTATTLRRRVARLIELGFVVRIPNQTDGRSDLISISPVVHGRLGSIDAGLKQIIEEFEARAAEQPVGDLDPLA
jgi:DNA-binding MarR family transcriptional regulator